MNMRAIEWQLDINKLIVSRYGESSFKKIDEYWYDFKPDDSERTTAFVPNLVPDTEGNRAVVQAIAEDYMERKRINDEFDKKLYQDMNKFERKVK